MKLPCVLKMINIVTEQVFEIIFLKYTVISLYYVKSHFVELLTVSNGFLGLYHMVL
jgi:hypothetical protein